MRSNRKSDRSGGKEPDRDSMLQELINQLTEFGPNQLASLLVQQTSSSPALQHSLLDNLTGAVSIFLDRRNVDAASRLLELTEIVIRALNATWAETECHYWQGRLEMEKGHPDVAVPHFEKATEIKNPEKRVIAIQSLALALFHAGDLTRAELQFSETVRVAREYSFPLGTAQGYLGLAMVARLKNNVPEAKQLLGQARQYAERVGATDVIAQIIGEQGLLDAQSENVPRAGEHYQQLEAYLGERPPGMSEGVWAQALSALITNQASLAMRAGRLAEAFQLAEEAMTKQSSLSPIEQIENLVVGGAISVMGGDLEIGKQRLLTAFRMAEEKRFYSGLLTAGMGLSTVYALQCLFEPAYRVCATAIEALERLRSQAGSETDRLHYVQDKTEIYSQIILLCLILTDLRRILLYQRQALTYTERAKSRTFIELLGRTTNITPPPNLPAELLDREVQVLDQLRALEISMRSLVDVAQQEQTQRTYNEAQIELDEIWKQIADIAPEYAALRQGQPITFEGVCQLLRI